jgi:hypothetical protein
MADSVTEWEAAGRPEARRQIVSNIPVSLRSSLALVTGPFCLDDDVLD